MKTLSQQEVYEFFNTKTKPEPYKMKGHSWSPLKNTGKQYCTCCVLVASNVKLTVWCINKGCNYQDHNQYKSVKKRLSKSNIML